MKIFKYIVWGILIFLGVFYVLPASLLQLPWFQEKASGVVSGYLERRIDTEVNIRRVELKPFSKLILKDIYMEDQSGDTLLYAKRLAAGFDILPLFQKKIRISSLQLFTFDFNLTKETDDSPLNLQYIIDAFSEPEEDKEPEIVDLQIKNINLRLGNFAFRVKDQPKREGKFDPKNIRLRNVSTKIHLDQFDKEGLAIRINRLGFVDSSGLVVKQIQLDFQADKEKAYAENLTIRLDKSELQINQIQVEHGLSGGGKRETKDMVVSFEIPTSTIILNELQALVPFLSQYDDKLTLEGKFSGSLDDFTIRDLYIRDPRHFMLSNELTELKYLISNPRDFYIKCNINNSYFQGDGIQEIVNNFAADEVTLPAGFGNLGRITFLGGVEGHLSDMIAYGNLNTGAGSLLMNVDIGKSEQLFINGYIESQGMNIGKLLNSPDFGEIVFNVNINAQTDDRKGFNGNAEVVCEKLVYKGYEYTNLGLNGDFSKEHFKGSFLLDNPYGKIEAEGLFVFQGNHPQFHFESSFENIKPKELNLYTKLDDAEFSVKAEIDITGNKVDQLLGDIRLTGIDMQANGERLAVDSLRLSIERSDSIKQINLASSIINAQLEGDFSLSALVPSVKKALAEYLPTLVTISPKEEKASLAINDFSLIVEIPETNTLSRMFRLPVTLQETTMIYGQYDNQRNHIQLSMDLPRLTVSGNDLTASSIRLDNTPEALSLDILTTKLGKKDDKLSLATHVEAKNDLIETQINWENPLGKYHGRFAFDTSFSREKRNAPLSTAFNIKPSEVMINDTLWTVDPSVVTLDSSNVRIRNFRASHEEQFIKINGGISHHPEETLKVDLNEVNLDYIFKTLAIKALRFGGEATGSVNVADIYKSRKMSTHLDVRNFSFNSVTFGDLELEGAWDDEEQGIHMDGYIYKDDSTAIDIDGIIYPVKEELSILFDASNTDARFLRQYLSSIVDDLTGSLTGKLRLFGDLNNPTVEGTVLAKDFRFGIDYLNTHYTFTDYITCLPDTILIDHISLHDEQGNTAQVNGYVKHKEFADFYFSAGLNFTNFKVFNAGYRQNPLFYGTAFGTGKASIYGTEDQVNIDVSLRNTENTKMTLNFLGNEDVAEYDFINFINKKDSIAPDKATAQTPPANKASASGTDIVFNLFLEATPDATVELIMDPVADDKISAYGRGNMQIQYGTKVPLKVVGNYAIEKGKYNFSLQQVIFRKFDIREGSQITFNGDPYRANLNIEAAYTVTANIGDLDQELLQQKYSTRSNIPVNCVLYLSGPIQQPSIAFDIDLPGATTELSRQIKSYMRTEEMINRQIVYLLVLGRFYTSPEFAKNDGQFNNDLSYLTATLSNQLSNLLGSLSDKFQVGTKFHQSTEGEQTSTEVEVLLSSQLLNDRLIINGNFGYIDNPYINTANQNIPLVGDFDIEYKLTKAGDIRLKGFNHYNYRNFNPDPKMTQGLGVMFRKDFNRWQELFGRKPRELKAKNEELNTKSEE